MNNKYEKLLSQFNSINKKETTLKSNLVKLEIDNEHYLNKIHQYEEEVSDLKDKLESYIENITIIQTEYEEYKSKQEDEIERLKHQLQEEKININILTKKNTKEKNLEKIEEKNDINGLERKLSWNEENNDNNPNSKKQSSKKIKNVILNEEDEKEHERLLESGRGRLNRIMTIQKINYNYGEVIANLKQRRERLAMFNQKIKKNSGKI